MKDSNIKQLIESFQEAIDKVQENLSSSQKRDIHQVISQHGKSLTPEQTKALIDELGQMMQKVRKDDYYKDKSILDRGTDALKYAAKHPYKAWTQGVGGFLDKLHKG